MLKIDCHVHTALSHHGSGSLREAIELAVEEGIKVIGFAEHAPLPFDYEHRLTESETVAYLSDLTRLQKEYTGQIVVLRGLEADYYEPSQQYVCDVLSRLSYDFVLGSIHFFDVDGERISLWDFDAFQDEKTVTAYFEALDKAINSGMFEIIAHPDIILRSGVDTEVVRKNMSVLIRLMSTAKVGYEVNCSGITKSRYDPIRRVKVGGPSYPDLELAVEAYHHGVPLGIGSDAHETERIGKNIAVTLEKLFQLGVKEVAYFCDRSEVSVTLTGSGCRG